jgi:hypothetical protein
MRLEIAHAVTRMAVVFFIKPGKKWKCPAKKAGEAND